MFLIDAIKPNVENKNQIKVLIQKCWGVFKIKPVLFEP